LEHCVRGSGPPFPPENRPRNQRMAADHYLIRPCWCDEPCREAPGCPRTRRWQFHEGVAASKMLHVRATRV
jgi:hypothetical protein